MLLGIETNAVRSLSVGPNELSQAPSPPPFAALEDLAALDMVFLVELYPLDPAVIP